MSSSDDDQPKDNAQGSERPQHKTLVGLGLRAGAVPDAPDTPTSDADLNDEFAAEATQIANDLAEEVIGDIDRMFDEPQDSDGWDDAFPAEKTEVAPGLRFPDDEKEGEPPAAKPVIPPIPRPDFSKPPAPDPSVGEPNPSHLSLEEESLPEPIHQGRAPDEDGPGQGHAAAAAPIGSQRLQAIGTPGSMDDRDLRDPIQNDGGPTHQPFVDDESEDFHAEKTEMVDTPFDSDPAVAKLICLDGPEIGTEYFASGLRSTVGRGINNSIVVADLAMSRQHFEIVKNPDESFTLHDLQSVNGTVLNGAKVREADLFHGDRLEAGKSLFQFVVTGAAPAAQRQRRVVPAATATAHGKQPQMPAPAPPPVAAGSSIHRLVILGSVGAVLFSLALIAAIAVLRLQRNEPAAAPPAAELTASQAYLSGVESVRARQWDEAETAFENARKIDPSLEGLEDQLRRIEMERSAEATLSSARKQLDEGEPSVSAELARTIPRDSVYYGDAQDLLRSTRKSEVEALYADAQQALTDERIEDAKAHIASILERVPNHQGAAQLQERIDAVEAGDQTMEEAAEATREAVASRRVVNRDSGDDDEWGIALVGADDDQDNKKRTRRRKKTPSANASATGRVPNFTQGYLLYRTRKFSEARSFFQKAAEENGPASARAKRTAEAIGDFATSYDAGSTAFEAKRWGEAESKLMAAKRADTAVGGDYFDQELSAKLATAKAEIGFALLAKDDATQARKYYDEARNFNASSAKVKALGRQLEKAARSLYIKAVNQRKTDPALAAKLCRNIMRLVPESHETYDQAEALLQSL